MSAPRDPTWKERLDACFRFRHRAMHVFGVPSAVGAVTAAASAAAVTAQAGLVLGAVTAGVGAALAGWYVIAGFDWGLTRILQQEKEAEALELQEAEIQAVVAAAEPETRRVLERILAEYRAIEAAFSEDSEDQVEAILQSSRGDLRALRDRAVAIAKHQRSLHNLITQSDGPFLQQEVERMNDELDRTPVGPLRDTLAAVKESTERTLIQWRSAIEKEAQFRRMLTGIQTDLQAFKLAMGLRKADQAMDSGDAGMEIGELQARLAATGEACDELIGRGPPRQTR